MSSHTRSFDRVPLPGEPPGRLISDRGGTSGYTGRLNECDAWRRELERRRLARPGASNFELEIGDDEYAAHVAAGSRTETII